MNVEQKMIAVAYADESDDNGWKLDYEFLSNIKRELDKTYRWSCNIELEEIEAVVLVLLGEFHSIDK